MIYTYKGKELHASNGWYDSFDLCNIIGFRAPRETVRRYVSKDDKKVVGLDTYINENGVWSLVYAPSVREDTKREVSRWLRSVMPTACSSSASSVSSAPGSAPDDGEVYKDNRFTIRIDAKAGRIEIIYQ